jgi:hypothetical protein
MGRNAVKRLNQLIFNDMLVARILTTVMGMMAFGGIAIAVVNLIIGNYGSTASFE